MLDYNIPKIIFKEMKSMLKYIDVVNLKNKTEIFKSYKKAVREKNLLYLLNILKNINFYFSSIFLFNFTSVIL